MFRLDTCISIHTFFTTDFWIGDAWGAARVHYSCAQTYMHYAPSFILLSITYFKWRALWSKTWCRNIVGYPLLISFRSLRSAVDFRRFIHTLLQCLNLLAHLAEGLENVCHGAASVIRPFVRPSSVRRRQIFTFKLLLLKNYEANFN